MTKQEEIKEGIKESIAWAMTEPRCFELDILARAVEKATDMVYKKLHSQGVVIKAEGELPCSRYANLMFASKNKAEIKENMAMNTLYEEGQLDMLKAGYKATEPLIGEK